MFMTSETIAAIILTLIASFGGLILTEIFIIKRGKREKRQEIAKTILNEIVFTTFYVDKKILMGQQCSPLLGKLKNDNLEFDDVAKSVSVLTSYMKPDEVMHYYELFEQDSDKALSYLLALFFYDLEKFRENILNIRLKFADKSLYFPLKVSDKINDDLDKYYKAIEGFKFEDPSEKSIQELKSKLDPIVIDLRDLLKDQV